MKNHLPAEAIINSPARWSSTLYWALVRERVGTTEQMSRLRGAQHKLVASIQLLTLPINFVVGLFMAFQLYRHSTSQIQALVLAGLLSGMAAFYYIWVRTQRSEKLRADPRRTTRSTTVTCLNGLITAFFLYHLLLQLPVQQHRAIIVLWCAFIVAGCLATAPLPRASLCFNILTSLAGSVAVALHGGASAIGLIIALQILSLLTFFCSGVFSIVIAQRHLLGLALDERDDDVGLLMQDFVEISSQWLWRITADGKFTNVPVGLAIFLGQSAEQLVGSDLMDHMNKLTLKQSRYTDEGDKLLMFANQLHMKQPFKDMAFQVAHADHRAWWSITAQPVFDSLGSFDGFRGVIADISERLAETQEIIKLAHYDSLTGLHNRASFIDQISTAWQRYKITGREFALLSIDLDHFKQVNDTFGHPAGDALLREAAQRITSAIGPRDVAARLGGDEFAVLHWVEGNHDYIPIMAQKIIAHLHEVFIIDNCPVRIGASIGMAIAPLHGTDPDSLARNGDAALYRAKAAGRGNAVMFDESMQDWLQRRRRLETDLRVAVSSNALQLAYQPVIDTKKRSISACEALVRWNHPEFGWVSPGEFIAIAEEAGLILALGEWVLREACKTAASWPASISVAVNLSSHQLQAGTLLKVVEDTLQETGFSADRLDLEVTETVVLDATQNVLDVMHKLRAMGVRISLDDFGTGYSSLSYLRSFPFDRIKIDRSFVIDALESPTSAAIIETIIQLAQKLNMGLTVEGVETMPQYDMVKRLGADCIQGYLFSKPLFADALEAWFEDQRQRAASAGDQEFVEYRQAS
jgi:diguanylate cyclase (GGDEF)-like protein/PAS domain S-box-containing protein